MQIKSGLIGARRDVSAAASPVGVLKLARLAQQLVRVSAKVVALSLSGNMQNVEKKLVS